MAGTCLALELERRGRAFRILDDAHRGSSSVVAAGLCNPVTGRRLALTVGWEEAVEAAQKAYRGSPHWRSTGQLRLLPDATGAALVERRRGEPSHAGFLGNSHPAGSWPEMNDPHGSVEIRDTHVLKVREWLAGHTRRWAESGMLQTGRWDEASVTALAGARPVICCRGWQAASSPWWDWLPFESARGDLLTLQAPPGVEESRFLNGTAWLLPVGGGIWRGGATYAWDRLEAGPDPAQLPLLRGRFPRQDAAGWTVLAHESGVRPIVRDRTPVVGAHPSRPNLFVINGLGSKGSLLAPLAASRLAAHLAEGVPLPDAWSPGRFASRD